MGLFAVSTCNTDFILIKAEKLEQSLTLLREAGYQVE
ncbi:MAG: hypothetical protein IJ041_01425 [Clostridia bacterium]|nr:hypothetical protein [Clostridia bacterium]